MGIGVFSVLHGDIVPETINISSSKLRVVAIGGNISPRVLLASGEISALTSKYKKINGGLYNPDLNSAANWIGGYIVPTDSDPENMVVTTGGDIKVIYGYLGVSGLFHAGITLENGQILPSYAHKVKCIMTRSAAPANSGLPFPEIYGEVFVNQASKLKLEPGAQKNAHNLTVLDINNPKPNVSE